MNSPKGIMEKLNLGKHPAKLVINKPDDITDFDDVEYDSTIKKEKYSLIFAFIFQLNDFSKYINLVNEKQLLDDNGYLYFAYPKKGNKKYEAHIDRDSVFEQVPMDEERYVKDSIIKFSKLVSLNDVFTVMGFKSEPKKKAKTSNAPKSQCVDDYIENIEDIKQYLNTNEETLEKFNNLTFGYQKGWARYVYSAKRNETQEKRLLEMKDIIVRGYKSIDLYRNISK